MSVEMHPSNPTVKTVFLWTSVHSAFTYLQHPHSAHTVSLPKPAAQNNGFLSITLGIHTATFPRANGPGIVLFWGF